MHDAVTGVTGRWFEAPEYTGELELPGQSRLAPGDRAVLERIAARSDRGALEIPPMPRAALQASRLLRSQDAEIEEIAEAIALDAVMTAHVLRYANSALFGARHTIDQIRDAVSYLGFRRMRELVTSAAVQQVASGIRSRSYAHMEWSYAIYCAAIARALGTRLGVDGEQCYVAGLLHDIGRLVVLRALETQDALPEPPRPDSPAEIILEALHRGVGRQMARSWEQPPSISDAIANHLTGRDPELDGPAAFPSTRIAEAAGDLCIAIGLGRHRRPFAILDAPGFQDLALSRDELASWLESDLPPLLESVHSLV